MYYTSLRWLKNLLFVGIMVSLLGGFLLWLTSPYIFPITTVRIEGHTKTSPEMLKTVITAYTIGGFFRLDVQAIRSVVLKSPWVKEVEVQRLWMDTLLIRLQEYHAVALWQPIAENEIMAIDQEGFLFKPPTQLSNIPILTGTSNNITDMLADYLTLKTWLEAVNLQILEFGCSTRQAWYMTLSNKIKLLLGRGDPKIGVKRFLSVYQRIVPTAFLNHTQHKQEGIVMSVDLRYTDGIAIKKVQEEKHAKR